MNIASSSFVSSSCIASPKRNLRVILPFIISSLDTKKLKHNHRRLHSSGFALPSIMIASITMLLVLTVAVSSVISIRNSLRDQYYTQLARSAAESGLVVAQECLRQSSNTITWTENTPLTPVADCNGSTMSGQDLFVLSDPLLRSSFRIGSVETANGFHTITSIGIVEQLRESNNEVWRIHTAVNSIKINYQSVLAAKSASGVGQTCGLVNGISWCWGAGNNYGKLGDGTTIDSITPVMVRRDEGVLLDKYDTDIAVGNHYACVVSDGGVYCWGRNQFGQLGRGNTNTGANPVPERVTGMLTGRTAVSVVTGGRHACALTTNSEIYCWGQNDNGQLGDGSTSDSATPVRVVPTGALSGTTISKIATGIDASTTCAIASARAYCWGKNSSGELGVNSLLPFATEPQKVTGLLDTLNVSDIAIASLLPSSGRGNDPNTGNNAHTCAIASARAYCWGSQALRGALGNNSTENSTTPVAVTTSGVLAGKTLTSVAVGLQHSCVLSTEPKVYCWGTNVSGQLGVGRDIQSSSIPVGIFEAPDTLQGRTITRLDAGGNRGCVIASQLNYCWGLNAEGQIGDGTRNNAFTPTRSIFLDNLRPPLYF